MPTIALENVPDGADINAAPHRNNYASIQAAVNGLDGENFKAGALAGDHLFKARVSGDSQPRLAIQADGKLVFGSGAVAGDATVERSAADTLALGSGDMLVGIVLASGLYRKVTVKDVVSTTTETDLLNGEITVAAGLMSTNRMLRAVLLADYLNDTGVSRNLTLKVKLGATTLWGELQAVATSATRRVLAIEFTIANLGAANSQFLCGTVFYSNPTAGSVAGIGDLDGIGGSPVSGTAAEDTTAAKALAVTATHSVADAGLSCRLRGALVRID